MEMTTNNKDGKMAVYLKGEIDHHSARNVRENIDRLLSIQRPNVFILDLEGVNFMDSSGLGLILGRYRKAKENGIEMYLCNVDERIMRILRMAGVDKLIGITNNTKDTVDNERI